MRARRRSEGFTLLEVMVAVAILGVALVAIFSSEATAIKAANRANRVTVASLLARCKMGEIEERVMREGLPAVDAHETDACCEDAEIEGFTCEWKIERIVLPDDLGAGEEGEDGEGEGEGEGGPDLAALAGLSGSPEDIASGGGIESMLGGSVGGADDALAEAAMSFAFPILKPDIEEQVRRASVSVKWQEGDREQSLDVVQFLVSDQGAADEEDSQP